MWRRTSHRWVAALFAVTMVTAACGGDSGTDGDTDDGAVTPTGGTFSVQSTEPSFLAPTSQCYESGCSQVLTLVNTGLLRIDPESGEQVFDHAESIESPDGKVWTVTLKEGWEFHNGEPVDAESYIRAWNESAYGPNATQTGFFFSPVEGYDDLQLPEGAPENAQPKEKQMSGLVAVDDTTIEITLSEAFSQWPLVMSYTPAFAPIAQACLEDLNACNEEPIGMGPYQMAGPWEHNESITIERYEDYQGEDVGNADTIEFKIYSNPAVAFRDWQAGNLDISDPDPTQVPQARAAAGERVLQVDSGAFSYMGMPYFLEEFQDVRIRQALSLAIDRETIAEKIYNGTVTPATDVIAPFVPGSRTDACQYCVYDPEEAKRLYDEAGGLPNDEVTIWFNNDGGHEAWIQAVGNTWRSDLGLSYSLESQPFTPYLAAMDAGEQTGPYRLSWIPDYPSPENYLDPVYGEGSANYGQWAGPARDRFLSLIEEGDAATTVEDGIPAYQAAADVVLEELPVVPLWFSDQFLVYSENVDNVKYSPLDQILLDEVTVG
jgi:oligopeptide transport system substrate-binding protein